MGIIKGQLEYRRFEKGEALTRKDAMLAHCYQCNGLEESAVDCRAAKCPLYAYSPYGGGENGSFASAQDGG